MSRLDEAQQKIVFSRHHRQRRDQPDEDGDGHQHGGRLDLLRLEDVAFLARLRRFCGWTVVRFWSCRLRPWLTLASEGADAVGEMADEPTP